MSAVLGIDIGTSYFSGAVWWMNNCYIITNNESVQRFPSVVTYHSRTQQTIGEPAKQSTDDLPRTIYNIKMILGKTYSDPKIHTIRKGVMYIIDCDDDDKPVLKVTLPDKTLTLRPEDVQSAFIRYLKRLAEERLSQSIDKAVVAVPAYFDGSQRQATIDACTEAGVRVLQLINEPTAAIVSLWYIPYKVIESDNNIIVFDMGSFSTKVSMVTIENVGQFKIQKVLKFNCIGGNHIDYRIVIYIIKYIRSRYNANFKLSLVKVAHLKYIAEKGKISLSSANETSMEIEDGNRKYVVILTREILEKLCSDLFQIFLICLDKVFRASRILKFKVDKVVMMGSAFKMPMFENTIFQFFGLELVVDMHDAVVAVGAAIRAGMLTGQLPGQLHDLLPVDVLPNSLGVSTNDQIMVFVVNKGVKLPCTKHVWLALVYNELINVMEGEGQSSLENRFLGFVPVTSVTECEPTLVKVTFEVTIYCIVDVTIHVLKTGEIARLKVYANESKVPLN